jgi:hypothetical protein
VYLYDGLTEREVDSALDTQFPRIQNMTFVGTAKTDERCQIGQCIKGSGSCGNYGEHHG